MLGMPGIHRYRRGHVIMDFLPSSRPPACTSHAPTLRLPLSLTGRPTSHAETRLGPFSRRRLPGKTPSRLPFSCPSLADARINRFFIRKLRLIPGSLARRRWTEQTTDDGLLARKSRRRNKRRSAVKADELAVDG